MLLPQHISFLAVTFHERGLVSETYASSWRRVAIIGVVMGVYRLYEARRHLLVGWLFTLMLSCDALVSRPSKSSSVIETPS